MRRITIRRSEPGSEVAYWVECPSLGIASMGGTVEEAITMIEEAIAQHVEDLITHGQVVPPQDMSDLTILRELAV